MAIILTADELAAALRLGNSAEEIAQVTRLLRYAHTAIPKAAPDAPDVVQNEAAIVLCGYLFDRPTAGRGMAYANALRNSGAEAMLAPYVVHRAGNIDPPPADAATAPTTPAATYWLGISEDGLITADELTVSSSESNALVVPEIPQGTRRFVVFGKPAALGSFTFAHYYPQGHRDPQNGIGGWRELPDRLTKNGVELRLLITRAALADTATGRVVEAG